MRPVDFKDEFYSRDNLKSNNDLYIVNCQREQLVCDRCNGSGLEPNNKTLYYKPCQKCS